MENIQNTLRISILKQSDRKACETLFKMSDTYYREKIKRILRSHHIPILQRQIVNKNHY